MRDQRWKLISQRSYVKGVWSNMKRGQNLGVNGQIWQLRRQCSGFNGHIWGMRSKASIVNCQIWEVRDQRSGVNGKEKIYIHINER